MTSRALPFGPRLPSVSARRASARQGPQAVKLAAGQRVDAVLAHVRHEHQLICCKTVEQPVAARAPQVVLTASAIWSARKMRGIPRFRHVIITQSVAVDMADHRRALRAARPIVAGLVFFGRKGAAIRLRAGQHIMIIRRKASTRNHRAALGHRALHVQSIFGAVEIFDGLGDDLAFEILPGAAPDAVTGVDGRGTIHGLRAEISPPGLAARARVLGQSLTLPIRTFQSAKIGPLAEPYTGDKERHVW